jgi:hypothetical protein
VAVGGVVCVWRWCALRWFCVVLWWCSPRVVWLWCCGDDVVKDGGVWRCGSGVVMGVVVCGRCGGVAAV